MNYEIPVSRKVSIVFGVLLTMIGSPFLVLGVLGSFKLVRDGVGNDTLFFVMLSGVVGLFCAWTGTRMIAGRKRKDGGLLSPLALRIGGLYFLLAPIALFLTADESDSWPLVLILELGFYLVVASTCFAIATRRQTPVLDVESVGNDT